MDDVVTALAAQQAELAALVDPLDLDGLARPSACPGWSVADVLLHLAQTNEMAIGSVEGRLFDVAAELADGVPLGASVDDYAGAVVAHQRGAPLDAVRARWSASAAAQEAAFASCDPHARLTWVAGEMSARTLATTRLTETWIHTGDVARGLGIEVAPTDRLRHTARLVWRTVPYAFAQAGEELHGPVAFDLTAPDGSRWTFGLEPGDGPTTTISGPAVDLCTVAGQRATAAETALVGDGPDAAMALRLVRTFA